MNSVNCRYHPDAPLIEDYRAGDQVTVHLNRHAPHHLSTAPLYGKHILSFLFLLFVIFIIIIFFFIVKTFFQICSECGLVVGDRVIDVGSEWRTFSRWILSPCPSSSSSSSSSSLSSSSSSSSSSESSRKPSLKPSLIRILNSLIKLVLNPILSEKGGEDKSRVGASENALLGSSDLSTIIGPGTGKVLTISSA